MAFLNCCIMMATEKCQVHECMGLEAEVMPGYFGYKVGQLGFVLHFVIAEIRK